jgi:predicted GNAT family N-acyltransferase
MNKTMPEQDSQDDLVIRLADWNHDQQQLKHIRRKVFIEEQQVPESMEWDEFDSVSTHYLVTHDDTAIATARVKPDGQIGRMAVLAEFRRQGIGSRLLTFVLQNFRNHAATRLYLHAQVSAIPFYEKHGFTTCSSIFYEADIPHCEMQRSMPSQ